MLQDRAQNIINDFLLLGTWEERYEHLISVGRELDNLKDCFKNDKTILRGCQSKVWLHCEYKNKKLYFYADSDALITKGLIALVVGLYSGLSCDDVLEESADVFSKIGLKEHLSMTRLNGLSVMLEKIKFFAKKHSKK